MRRLLALYMLLCGALFIAWQVSAQTIGEGVWKTVPSSCSMAFDAIGVGDSNTSRTNSETWNHTPVGTPTAVAVGFMNFGGTSADVSGVTYGGASMTLGATVTDGNNGYEQIWGIANPAPGTQAVVVTWTAGSGSAFGANSISVTCSNTSTAFDNANGASGNSASPSVTVNSTTTEIVVDVLGSYNATATFTPSGTLRWGILSQGGDRNGGSTQPGGAGTTTDTWTMGASQQWGLAAASFKHQ